MLSLVKVGCSRCVTECSMEDALGLHLTLGSAATARDRSFKTGTSLACGKVSLDCKLCLCSLGHVGLWSMEQLAAKRFAPVFDGIGTSYIRLYVKLHQTVCHPPCKQGPSGVHHKPGNE